MEEKDEDFYDMYNTMRVEQFREAKQQRLVSIIFYKWKRGQDNKAKRFHQKTIYAKVLHALMLAHINYINRLSAFSEQLEQIYFKMQLKTHFSAMKQFKVIRQQETTQKTNVVQKQIRKSQMKVFCNVMRLILRSKQRKAIKKEAIEMTPIKQAYKSDNFLGKEQRQNKTQNDFRQTSTKQNYFKKQLDNSRASVKSSFNINSELAGKRKFAAVKQLPKLPQLEEVEEKIYPKAEPIEQKQIIDKTKAKPLKEHQQKQGFSSRNSQSRVNQQNNKAVQNVAEPFVPQKQAKKYNKDSILAVISQIKMLQIAEINSIISEYLSALKYETVINEKGYISQSIATLQRIIKL